MKPNFSTRLFVLAAILLMLVVGCAPAPTPTPTAIPTSTPTATLVPTSTPTSTPTVTPTATPNATATAAALATAQAEQRAEEVKGNLQALEIPVDTGGLGYYQKAPLSIDLTEHQQAIFDFFSDSEGLAPADFVISTDVTWETDAIMTCGLFFRSDGNIEQGAEYLFQFLRLSGLPAWDIEFWKDGQSKNSFAGATSSALNQESGATNHIDLVVEGNKFTLYINGNRQGTYYDDSKQRSDGEFAAIAWQDSGTTTCTFDNTTVWVYK